MFPLTSQLPTYNDKKIEDPPQKHVVNALKWTFYDIECFHFAIRLLFRRSSFSLDGRIE